MANRLRSTTIERNAPRGTSTGLLASVWTETTPSGVKKHLCVVPISQARRVSLNSVDERILNADVMRYRTLFLPSSKFGNRCAAFQEGQIGEPGALRVIATSNSIPGFTGFPFRLMTMSPLEVRLAMPTCPELL